MKGVTMFLLAGIALPLYGVAFFLNMISMGFMYAGKFVQDQMEALLGPRR